MKKLATTLAIGASAFVLSYSTPSLAQEKPEKAPVATTTTTAAPYSPGGETYVNRVEHRPNRTLLWTGVTVFSVTYVGSVVAGGIAGDRVPDKNLFIPLVGPWLDLGQRDCDFRPCDDAQERMFQGLIIASGIAQGAGALMVLSSFFVPESSDAPRVAKAKPEVHLAPVSYASGGGIGAVGRF
jgi:hypothetical protein